MCGLALLEGTYELSRFSPIQHCPTLRTVVHPAPLPMGFSRQECWSDCHALLQGSPQPGIQPMSLMSPALDYLCITSLPLAPPGKPLLEGTCC